MVHVIRTAAILLLLAAALTACSGSDDGLPDCSSVWEAGATLPDPYDGCTQDGETVEPVWYDCEGGGRYAEWDGGVAYGREGGEVVDTVGELARICD